MSLQRERAAKGAGDTQFGEVVVAQAWIVSELDELQEALSVHGVIAQERRRRLEGHRLETYGAFDAAM